ncbi:MAG: hypothetical protein AB1726_16760 [Planctomycetota bacterium]
MTALEPALDPALEEVLADIARDPRASLFHTTPRQLALGLRGHIPCVSSRQAALTAAERHLLDVHREEVAWLLYKACQHRLLREGRGALAVHEHLGNNKRITLPTAATYSRRAEAATLSSEADRTSSISIAIRRLPAHLQDTIDPTFLALTSLRLVPRDETRIWLALCRLTQAQYAPAISMLDSVLCHHTTALNQALCHFNHAWIAWAMGRTGRAKDLYSLAAAEEELTVMPSAYRLCIAVLTTDTTLAMMTARLLDDAAWPHDPVIDECANNLHRLVKKAGSYLASEVTALALRIREAHPAIAGRIVNVLIA